MQHAEYRSVFSDCMIVFSLRESGPYSLQPRWPCCA